MVFGKGAPMLRSFSDLVGPHRTWADANFPNNTYWQPLTGITEEIGEFSEATDANNTAAIRDAIGDIVIYATDLCYRIGWHLEDARRVHAAEVVAEETTVNELARLVHKRAAIPSQLTDYVCRRLQIHNGRLAHAVLKTDQKIRGTAAQHAENGQRALACIISVLAAFCASREWNIYEIVEETAMAVYRRDWITDSVTGGV